MFILHFRIRVNNVYIGGLKMLNLLSNPFLFQNRTGKLSQTVVVLHMVREM